MSLGTLMVAHLLYTTLNSLKTLFYPGTSGIHEWRLLLGNSTSTDSTKSKAPLSTRAALGIRASVEGIPKTLISNEDPTKAQTRGG